MAIPPSSQTAASLPVLVLRRDSLWLSWRSALVVAIIALASLVLHLQRVREREGSFDTLAAAVGKRRFIEPRLIGGFSYAPCVARERGDRLISPVECSMLPSLGSRERRKLVAAVRKVREAGGEAADMEQSYHARIADLLIPGSEVTVSRAIREVEKAVQQTPGDARPHSDLAAAYYILAQQKDEPALLVSALDAADEALRLDPFLPEARFNRALILDRLFLVDRAREAWQAFLDLREGSGWTGEAHERMMALDQPSPSTLWRQSLPELHAALRRGDLRATRKFVSLSPQAARDYAFEGLLGNWGDLLAGRRPREAAEQLEAARLLGEALCAETREPIVLEVVRTIDKAVQEGNRLAVVAAAVRAHRDGQREVRDQLPSVSVPHLREAFERLGHIDNPLAEWALITLAGIDLNSSRYDEALSKYQTALAAARRLGSSALAGRAQWGLGLVRLRQGELAESLAWLLDAVSAFEKGREQENLGAALALVAENTRLLGQFSAAWRYRYRAARNLHSYRNSIRLHNLLWEGGWAAAGEGAPRAAIDLLDEDVALGYRSRLPQRLAESLLWRSKVDLAANKVGAARLDLWSALQANQRTPDSFVQQRLDVDLEYVTGEVGRRTDPATALAPLSAAISIYSARQLYLDLPGAYLARFHAKQDSGLVAQAETDLKEALRLFENRRDTLANAAQRVSVAESAQDLYDEMLLLKAPREDGLALLEIVERARALAEPATASQPLSAALAALPRNQAVLEYARVGDNLFIWLLHDGRVLSEVRKLRRGNLEKSVSEFVAAVAGRSSLTKIETRAKALYRLLIPTAVVGLPSEVTLVIVPDKILNSLPFAALVNPETDRYLIEERTLQLAARVAFRPVRPTAGACDRGSALLVAGTSFDRTLFADLRLLPGVTREVASLAPLFPNASILAGPEATRDRLLKEVEGRAVLHFAGHAIFNSQYPDRSYLVLAPEPDRADRGVLFLHDLTSRHLDNLRLVILSACQTLGPMQTRTSGVSGLARPFLDAGVGAVVGSLWDVEDRAAAQLLPAFHRQYRESGDAAAALRAAQLALIRGGDPFLGHPDSWAVFQAVLSN